MQKLWGKVGKTLIAKVFHLIGLFTCSKKWEQVAIHMLQVLLLLLQNRAHQLFQAKVQLQKWKFVEFPSHTWDHANVACLWFFLTKNTKWEYNMVMYKHAFSKSSKWILSINGSYLFLCCWEKWYFVLVSSLNFGSTVVIATQRQWWRFSLVIQMQSLFFVKFILENVDPHK